MSWVDPQTRERGLIAAAEWTFSNQTTAPPASGELRLDDVDATLATRVWISTTTSAGDDVGVDLAAIAVGTRLTIQTVKAAGNWVQYVVAATPVSSAGYVELAVEYVQSAGAALQNNQLVQVLSSTPPEPPEGGIGGELLVDPDTITVLVPGTSADQALVCAQVATAVVASLVWPNALPDPTPPPMTLAATSIACRLAQAGAGGTPDQAANGRVVSESLGAYSYRLASPATLEDGFALTAAERELLEPWLSASKVYELTTGAAVLALPWDWFQRDLDNAVAAVDQVLIDEAGQP